MVLTTKHGNRLRTTAFERAMKNIFPSGEYIFNNIPDAYTYDVKPVTRQQVINGAEENARRYSSWLRKSNSPQTITVAVQKGTTIMDYGPSLFIASIAFESLDSSIAFSLFNDPSESVLIPERATMLVKNGMELFTMWEELYGPSWNKIGPYQLITHKDEVVWLQKLFEKGLCELKQML